LIDRHVSINSATAMVAAAGVALTLSRLVGGYLLDKAGVLFVGSLMFGALVVALLLLLSKADGGLLFAVPFCTGTVLGMEGDLIPYLARHRFGVAAHSIVYSWFFAFFSLGMVAGPIAMGVTFDHYGSYKAALTSFVLISIVTLCIYVTLLKGHPSRMTPGVSGVGYSPD
jgi:predicted MFS family arabinose efflux permease